MCICIISPTEDACIRDVAWQEVAGPMDIVHRRPRFITVSIETMHSNNAGGLSERLLTGVFNPFTANSHQDQLFPGRAEPTLRMAGLLQLQVEDLVRALQWAMAASKRCQPDHY